MRLLFLTMAAVLYILFAGESVAQQVTNNPATLVDTNLVAIGLSIERRDAWWGYGPSPICFVRLDNKNSSTNSNVPNSGIFGLRLSADKLFAINMVDANGQFVKKTEYGKEFGQALTQKQLNDWITPIRIQGNLLKAWFEIPPAISTWQHQRDVGTFSISKAFSLTKAGEYTLHVRMRLIQSHFIDSAGTIIRTNIFGPYFGSSGRTTLTAFQFVWFPEVTVKVQIRPEDISKNRNLQTSHSSRANEDS